MSLSDIAAAKPKERKKKKKTTTDGSAKKEGVKVPHFPFFSLFLLFAFLFIREAVRVGQEANKECRGESSQGKTGCKGKEGKSIGCKERFDWIRLDWVMY